MDPIRAISSPFPHNPSTRMPFLDLQDNVQVSGSVRELSLPKRERVRIGYRFSELRSEETNAIDSLNLSGEELKLFKDFLATDLKRPSHESFDSAVSANRERSSPNTPLEFVVLQQELLRSNELKVAKEIAFSSERDARISRQSYESCWVS